MLFWGFPVDIVQIFGSPQVVAEHHCKDQNLSVILS